MAYKSGFVALLGRPNVGKSTLLNALTGHKVAIVTPKPQTTRQRIRGIVHEERGELVLVDTPGIHRPRTRLGYHMVRSAQAAAKDVDLVWHVVDLERGLHVEDRWVADVVRRVDAPAWLVANKIDRVSDWRVAVAPFRELAAYAAVFPVSALTGAGVGELKDAAFEALPEGPQMFPDDMVTDQAEDVWIAEVIREKVLELTREEVPHSVAVVVEEKVPRRADLTYVRATIYVERDSQRGILIGEEGRMLKEIGRRAREDLEALWGHSVYLELWVKAQRHWRDRDDWLRRFGYGLADR
jgi:GTP-binding protein Era